LLNIYLTGIFVSSQKPAPVNAEHAEHLVVDWRQVLPTLTASTVTLREPWAQDLRVLVELLSLPDASRFGVGDTVTELGVQKLIDRVRRERSTGLSFTYAITLGATRLVVGLVQVRQLDQGFEAAECDMTLAPSARGTMAFVETARLVGSFAFGTIGMHRIESRVLTQNGRANGALRKMGAVQEGVLRRSVHRGGDYRDQVLWSLLKEDWRDQWISTGPRLH
jgi:RimJ/RimL family protein N-acetyltransferase